MGIKFKDKTSLGVPSNGDIAEREIHLDLKSNSLYSSTNGLDIVKVGNSNVKADWNATTGDTAILNKPIEVGGRSYNPAATYKVGDLVSYNNNRYENKIAIGIPEGWSAGKWIKLTEKAGMLHSATVNYVIGDIVTEDATISSNVWRCVVSHTSHAFNALEWVQLSEKGGVEWSPTSVYKKGDLIVDSRVLPAQLYTAIQGSNNVDPLGSIAYWQNSTTVFHNASTGGDKGGDGILDTNDGSIVGEGGGQHSPCDSTAAEPVNVVSIPNKLGEYPDNTIKPEKIGASWIISGLGFNTLSGDKNRYTFTTGDLTGIAVKDGDQITWVDGVIGSELWFISPVPEVVGERGGLKWSTAKSYIVGDVVGGSDGKQYTAVVPSIARDPIDQLTNSMFWSCTTEGGGLLYDEYKTYPKLAIVSISEQWVSGIILEEQYLSITDNNKGHNPTTDGGTNWKQYDAVKYYSSDLTFVVGDNPATCDFNNVKDAILFTGRFSSTNNAQITLLITTGHIINYPVRIIGGDYSSVVLKSQGGAIVLNPTAGVFAFSTCSAPIISANIEIMDSASAVETYAILYWNAVGVTKDKHTMTNHSTKLEYMILVSGSESSAVFKQWTFNDVAGLGKLSRKIYITGGSIDLYEASFLGDSSTDVYLLSGAHANLSKAKFNNSSPIKIYNNASTVVASEVLANGSTGCTLIETDRGGRSVITACTGSAQTANIPLNIPTAYGIVYGTGSDISNSYYKKTAWSRGSSGGLEWVKFPDGTMIQSGIITYQASCSTVSGTLFRTNNYKLSFLKTFVGVPSVTTSVQTASGYFIGGTVGAVTTSGFSPTYWSTISSGKPHISYIAVGKWK